MAVKPMLDDLELQLVQQIEADEHQVRAQHAVPALEGDFLQALGCRAERITLTGILTNADEEEAVGEKLKKLREKFRAAEPLPFAADIATATKIDTVLIEESRPLSATKRWRLVDVIQRAGDVTLPEEFVTEEEAVSEAIHAAAHPGRRRDEERDEPAEAVAAEATSAGAETAETAETAAPSEDGVAGDAKGGATP